MWAADKERGYRGREELQKMTVKNEQTVFKRNPVLLGEV